MGRPRNRLKPFLAGTSTQPRLRASVTTMLSQGKQSTPSYLAFRIEGRSRPPCGSCRRLAAVLPFPSAGLPGSAAPLKSHSLTKTEMKIPVNETAMIATTVPRSRGRQTHCSGGQTDFLSLRDAAFVQVRARSISTFFASSVRDRRAHCIASSAYSRNCSAFVMERSTY